MRAATCALTALTAALWHALLVLIEPLFDVVGVAALDCLTQYGLEARVGADAHPYFLHRAVFGDAYGAVPAGFILYDHPLGTLQVVGYVLSDAFLSAAHLGETAAALAHPGHGLTVLACLGLLLHGSASDAI